MSAEVFISYARDDRERVMPLVDRLRQSGISVWVDEGGIHGPHFEARKSSRPFATPRVRSGCHQVFIRLEERGQGVAIASEWDKAILPVTSNRYRCRTRSITSSLGFSMSSITLDAKRKPSGHDRFFESNWGQHRLH